MNFLQDLRRRQLVRLTGLYVVGAWAIIQVADVSFPAWGIPDEALRYPIIAAVLCFPLALVFAWLYDVSAGGFVRTRPGADGQLENLPLKRQDYVFLGSLATSMLAVVLGTTFLVISNVEPVESVERRENSIAVLPFKNLDINVETGYFSDGVTEEILHRLSSLGALHVLASTSSFSFRDSGMAPTQISSSLGVSYLLDGSVRRSADRVRVTARLLDDAGFQVWTDTFDRELTEIFSVQAEIAGIVSQKIVDEIVPLAKLPAGRTTTNMEAYNAYLLGRHYADRRVDNWREMAGDAFRQAIQLDPGFAPPYAGLATLVVNTSLGPRWQESADYARKALELDPDLGEALAILGLITTLKDDDPVAGAEMLERAIELAPSYSMSYPWLALALNHQGRDAESYDILHRGAAIDPLNPVLIVNLAARLEGDGNFEAAEQLMLRLLALPRISGPATSILDLYHDWGRYSDELKSRKIIMLKEGSGFISELSVLARNYAALGMTAEADQWFAEYLAGDAEPFVLIADYYFVFKHSADQSLLRSALGVAEEQVANQVDWDRAATLGYGGMAQVQVGEYDKGVEWVEESLEMYRQLYKAGGEPGSINVHLYDSEWWTWLTVQFFQRLAFAYQQVDRVADAEDILRQLDEIGAWAEPTTPRQHEWQALQLGLRGDIDGAFDSLAAAVELDWANYYEVVNDPAWAAIIEDPRIAELMDDARERVEEQRRQVEEVEQDEDFSTEFLRLIAQ